MHETLEKLKETHATSAGLKAFCTWACLETIDKCRQSCGGHGYSAYVAKLFSKNTRLLIYVITGVPSYSALPGMYQDFAVQCTWEGDNTILSLQAGRSLVSSWEAATRGKPLPPGVSYLSSPATLTAKSNSSLDLSDIDKGWACVAANVVKKAAEDYNNHLGKGLSKDEAMERCSQSRFIAAKLHTVGYVSETALR
jgi:acyl-CoA oxidase